MFRGTWFPGLDAVVHLHFAFAGDGVLYQAMYWTSHLHDTGFVVIYLMLLCVFLWHRHEGRWLATALVSPLGAMAMNWVLKQVFERPRPPRWPLAAVSSTFSFPSGHTIAAAMLYGLVACHVLMASGMGPRARAGAVTLCALAVAAVAFSRVVVGAHYLSDVLASLCEGMVWLALTMLWIRRRQDAPMPLASAPR